MKKREHLNDFSRDEKGRFEYHGAYWQSVLPEEVFRRRVRRCALVLLPALALWVSAACIDRTGMEGHAALLFPFVAQILFYVLLEISLVRMLQAGPQLPVYQYKQTVERIPGLLLLLIVCALGSLTAAGILSVRSSFVPVWPGTALYLLSQACGAAAGIYVKREERQWRAGS